MGGQRIRIGALPTERIPACSHLPTVKMLCHVRAFPTPQFGGNTGGRERWPCRSKAYRVYIRDRIGSIRIMRTPLSSLTLIRDCRCQLRSTPSASSPATITITPVHGKASPRSLALSFGGLHRRIIMTQYILTPSYNSRVCPKSNSASWIGYSCAGVTQPYFWIAPNANQPTGQYRLLKRSARALRLYFSRILMAGGDTIIGFLTSCFAT